MPGRALLLAAGMTLAARIVAAQHGLCSERHPTVDAVDFKGNHAFSERALAAVIATERTGLYRRWFGWNTGPLTCLDSLEVVRDAQRLVEEYETRGYPGTTARSSIAHRGMRRAQVTFTVQEALPIRIDSITFLGIPPGTVDVPVVMRQLRNAPLDSAKLATVRDSLQNLIRAAGYAMAADPGGPLAVVDSAHRRASVTFTYDPGRLVNIGEITVKITPGGGKLALDTSEVRQLLRVKPGDVYNPVLLAASQRDLYASELYKIIRFDDAAYDSARNVLPLRITLAEGGRRAVRAGGGWGTLDCFRTQIRFVDQNLMGSGHRLELNSRFSKIGLAQPFTGLSALCLTPLRNDPFSHHLNYYAGATINLRGLVGSRLHPAFTVYSERRSEYLVYEQTTEIGTITSVTRELAPRLTGSLQYQFVNSRTVADGAVSCERFGFCRVEDLASFTLPSPIHTVSAIFVQNPLLPVDDPVSGSRWQFEIRQGFTKVQRIKPLNFTRLWGEAAEYIPLGPAVTLALRAQLGFVRAPGDLSSLLPPPERFYAGGQSTVRGFEQNVLGPGSYIVAKYADTTLADGTKVGVARPRDGFRRPAPSGGNAMWVANVELRARHWPSDALRAVMFVDAGRVWNTNDVFSSFNANARITPGIGVRLATILGPFRMDVGYNGYQPEPGPAFFVLPSDVAAGKPGRAICVSPGTTDPLTLPAGMTGERFCPATFRPAIKGGLLPRLAFHFSIGNAF
ncbi:MAG TPA: BamA/TamA family outer membrane protein [Gemmatimonadaceae bacterium]|nr:BamA/TamA family outer membrane protein [Gemmatimonadaceae bacterium]